MARTVEHVAAAHGTTASLGFYDEGNPPTVNDPALAAMAAPVLGRVFGDGSVRVPPQMVAEDFPFYGRRRGLAAPRRARPRDTGVGVRGRRRRGGEAGGLAVTGYAPASAASCSLYWS
jgi:metal-dependent amidase/aminoacylase/carboxypeptidase family protein